MGCMLHGKDNHKRALDPMGSGSLLPGEAGVVGPYKVRRRNSGVNDSHSEFSTSYITLLINLQYVSSKL